MCLLRRLRRPEPVPSPRWGSSPHRAHRDAVCVRETVAIRNFTQRSHVQIPSSRNRYARTQDGGCLTEPASAVPRANATILSWLIG